MANRYEIQIEGNLNPRWAHWFSDLEIRIEAWEQLTSRTIVRCTNMDQAKLRGMLNTIWDLNMDLISVRRLSLIPAGDG
jgi:hypothetical protein